MSSLDKCVERNNRIIELRVEAPLDRWTVGALL